MSLRMKDRVEANVRQSDKVNSSLTIQLNGATAAVYDGSSAKTINISPGSHSHLISDVDGLFEKIVETFDADSIMTTGIYSIANGAGSNMPTTNHGVLTVVMNVGTPFQIWEADNVTAYRWKRYRNNTDGVWNSWVQQKLTDTNTTYTLATSSANGLLSAADKAKLDAIIGTVLTSNNYTTYAAPASHNHTSLNGTVTINGPLQIGNSATSNYLAFYGTTGDQPGTFTHTYIGERIWAETESSELILYKGNDITGSDNSTTVSGSGPDRIRHIAAGHLFQVYSASALSGTFEAIATSTVPVTIVDIHKGGMTVTGTITGTCTNANSAITATNATKASQDGDGATISSTYLKKSGGTMTGALNYANGTWNLLGDDVYFGDNNTGGSFAIKGANAATNIKFVQYNGTNYATLTYDGSSLTSSCVLYGACWNDYAEYRESYDAPSPGRVVIEMPDDRMKMSSERLQPGAKVVSDTFGFAIGETDRCKTPIGVCGRVLAYPYEPRDTYKPGDPVCSGPDGTISKMTREEVTMYPDRMVGTVSCVPTYERWGTGDVLIDGRIWIYVR